MLFYIPYCIILPLVSIGLSHVASHCMCCSHCHWVRHSVLSCPSCFMSFYSCHCVLHSVVLPHTIEFCRHFKCYSVKCCHMLYSGSCCKVAATVLCCRMLYSEQLLPFCMPVFCVATCCTVCCTVAATVYMLGMQP